MLVALFMSFGIAAAQEPESVDVPATFTIAMPLGVPQFTHGEAKRGALLGGIQALGIGTTVYAQMQMLDMAQSDDPGGLVELGWRRVSVAGSAVAGLGWLASVIDGSRLHEAALNGDAMAQSARAWETATDVN